MTNQDQDRRDLGDQGRENEGKGAGKQIAGKVQEGLGKLTGDSSTEAKGKMKQAEGNAQSKLGNAEQKVDDAMDS